MADKAYIEVSLFNGTRQPVEPGFKTHITLTNGHQDIVIREYLTVPSIRYPVSVYDNFGDNYRVNVSAGKHHAAGFFPIRVKPGRVSRVSLILLPKNGRYRFTEWESLDTKITAFLSGFIGKQRAEDHYNDLLDGEPLRQDILASTHNLVAALDSTLLGDQSLFTWFDRMIWPEEDRSIALQRDRFFAYASRQLLDDIRRARRYGSWVDAPVVLHPGATCSFKQTAFQEANLQLTFHENDQQAPSEMVKVEVDIDYYQDLVAHFLLEILPNTLRRDKSDPRIAGMLRWIASRNYRPSAEGTPEFNPAYIIEPA